MGIDQDLPFQYRAWRYQRMAWAALALTLAGALLGLFGQGPLADASVRSADGQVTLDYERFTRYDRTTWLIVSLPRSDHRTDSIQILFDKDYAQAVTLRFPLPTPVDTAWTAEGLRYEFTRPEGGGIVRLLLSIQAVGPVTGRIRAGQGEWLPFTQFIYP
ncbi:MAG: hypothetical protein L6Q38_00145 [Nitrospira sp.]|nr:hypothetical protein [Nitrospira sp.]